MIKTTVDVAKELQLSAGTIAFRAKKIGKVLKKGKQSYYTPQEVEAIRAWKAEVNTMPFESYHEVMVGRKYLRKYWSTSAYNPALKKRVTLTRYKYNWLIANGQWEKGDLNTPKGHVLHHIDFNPLNDAAENIQLMSLSEHRKLHDLASDSRRNNASKAMKKAWKETPWQTGATL